ncbi:MAG: oligoendopeptidase F [Spirochaetes bacterium]|nr:oligoendopeptidase F [Spirochaetota bacterium]
MMQDEIRIPERSDIPDAHKWDLAPLFANEEEWERLFGELEKKVEGYTAYRGRLGESLVVFREALEFDLALSRELERLYTYAHLKSDEDKTNQRYMGLYGRAMNLYNRASELSSFMTPEIQALPDETARAYMDDPSMSGYRFMLEKIFRYKPHTLSVEMEELLAMGGDLAQAPSQFFSQLDNADLSFGVITDDAGREVELSHGNLVSFLMSPSREVRKNAFDQYYRTYKAHRHSIASAFAYSVKKDRFYARARRFESCRGAALFSDNVAEEVYDNLVSTVRKNNAPLFKYLAFRKEALGLADLHFYDTYVPIIPDVPFSMSYEEAVETCLRALAPLGDDYTATLRDGLAGGWVDRYENRGKRSGAYSSGCYDSPPYILMNYRDDTINSLYTLIHEAGHSMHSHYSAKAQPYHYHEYTIFVAEVASTFNEALLSNYLLDKYAGDARMRAYILNREIDDIRGTLFRQTMFAEFEKLSHELVEKNDPLTLETVRDVYRKLLGDYFGDSLVIDEALSLECLRIPHFYSAFYVYKYATGISAAIALAEKVLTEGSPARERYLRFLSLGGTMFPIDELIDAGVDMRSPGPIENAIRYFERLVDELIHAHRSLKHD